MIEALHQIVPTLSSEDAVGNLVRVWQRLFRKWGLRSEIFADQTDAASRGLVLPSSEYRRRADGQTGLLIHHSIATGYLPMLRRSAGRKAVVYHNVTPAHFFEGYEAKMVRACNAAREELVELSRFSESAVAFSRYSAEELTQLGFRGVSVVPFTLDRSSYEVDPDPVLKSLLTDGAFNILFVGRAVPNKRIEDVLAVFAAYQRLYNPQARLIIVGDRNAFSPYVLRLKGIESRLDLSSVLRVGKATQAQLVACYRAASVYLSMSEHEGFGVPLIEAMHHRVPVLAFGAAAVPETMGGAGITFSTRNPVEVASLIALVEQDAEVRARVIAVEKQRAEMFFGDLATAALEHALLPMLQPAHRSTPK